MRYEVEIDEMKFIEYANDIINKVINRELNNRYSNGDTQKEISLAVKDIIYSRKDEIIEKVIERATTEIVRKGLPKLIEKMR